MKYPKPRAAIFDLDGTLLDTIEDLTDAMNAALARLGRPPKTIADIKTMVGDGLPTFIRRAFPPEAPGDPEAIRRLIELVREEYQVRKARKTRPYPGVTEMLEELRRRGVPLAVLSNKPHDSTLDVIGHYFPDAPFRVAFGARDGVPVKPDPAGAMQIARLLDIPPVEILYLGDTDTDMQTASRAGMFAVGALWGFRTAEELVSNGARVLAAHPSEIPKLYD